MEFFRDQVGQSQQRYAQPQLGDGTQVVDATQLIATIQSQGVRIAKLEKLVAQLQSVSNNVVAAHNKVVKVATAAATGVQQLAGAVTQLANQRQQPVQAQRRTVTVNPVPAPAPQSALMARMTAGQPQVVETTDVIDEDQIDPGDTVMVDDSGNGVTYEEAIFHGLVDEVDEG